MSTPEHLRPETSDRGLRYMPPIPAMHGGGPAGQVHVHDSSSINPSVWIAVDQPVNRNRPEEGLEEAVVHMPLDRAIQFAEQIMWLASDHFREGYYGAGEE